ncbi:MAG TPA: hypothetical protein VD971_14195 [Phycisphaerales bacterium]|nr:hypothetical protein [Phycisphaerales bacterium]
MRRPENADASRMDAAAVSSVKNLELGSRIAVAVAKKSMNAQKQQAQAALSLLEGAVKFAEQAASASADGRLDVTA